MLRSQRGIHSIKVALLAERGVVEYDPSVWDADKIVNVSPSFSRPLASRWDPFPWLSRIQAVASEHAPHTGASSGLSHHGVYAVQCSSVPLVCGGLTIPTVTCVRSSVLPCSSATSRSEAIMPALLPRRSEARTFGHETPRAYNSAEEGEGDLV